MSEIEKDIEMARQIARMADKEGGQVYYVGGYVRDRLRGKPNKDVDIEVHGITPACLESILDSLGDRITIGESFGIFGLKGYSLDIAMPRKEEVTGRGHKDFDIMVDPFIGTRKAALRRDFTINAMMEDVLTGEIVDWFGGQEDLKNHLIRHVNDKTFIEDALRVLRAAQFAARFGFTVADETIALCQSMDLDHLPKERIMGELEKALLKSKKPSVFFEELRKMEQLSTWFPELSDLIGVEQSSKHHAEGDVWVHTMMVMDAAVYFRDKTAAPLSFMLSTLTHDMGKAICTERVKGEIHAYNHEKSGIPIAANFIRRLTNENDIIKYVLNQTELHMKPNTMARAGSSVKSTNKMFDQAVDPQALIYLALSDSLGKIPQGEYELSEEYLTERLRTYNEYMARPYVMGRDLVAAGISPCPEFSDYLAYAHKLRLAGIDKSNALRQTLAYVRKHQRN